MFMRFVKHIFICAIMAVLILVSLYTFLPLNMSANQAQAPGPFKRVTTKSLLDANFKQISKGSEANDRIIKENSSILLKRTPLNDRVLFYYGAMLALRDASIINQDWFDTIRRRNPRNRSNLWTLLNFARSNNDASETLKLVHILYNLEREKRDPLEAVLSSLYKTDTGYRLINEKLTENPRWAAPFLLQEIHDLTPERADLISQSFLLWLESIPDAQASFIHTQFLSNGLIAMGKVAAAQDIWARVTEKAGEAVFASESLNYNPELLNVKAPAPFNWQILTRPGVSSELARTGGLYVSFNGDKPQTIAQQSFKPTDKAFEISAVANYSYLSRKGNFQVKINCSSPFQNGPILTFDNTFRDADIARVRSDGFKDKCDMALLRIMAVPGFYNDRISINFQSVSVKALEVTP